MILRGTRIPYRTRTGQARKIPPRTSILHSPKIQQGIKTQVITPAGLAIAIDQHRPRPGSPKVNPQAVQIQILGHFWVICAPLNS